MRQELRKRGLPVSGTKPALLQRLRPFQLLPSCPTPAPLCKLGTSPEPLTPCPSLPPSQSPGSSLGSGLDSPSGSPNQQLYIQDGVVPNGILCDAPSRDPAGTLSAFPNAYANAASVSLAGEQCCLTSAVFLAPASTASGLPSPSLPVSSSSPLQCGTPWKTEREQLQQQQELSVELQMRGRKRSRPNHSTVHVGNEVRPGGWILWPQKRLKNCSFETDHLYLSNQSSEGSLHPFLQQDPVCFKGKPDINAQVLLTQVNIFKLICIFYFSRLIERPFATRTSLTFSWERAPITGCQLIPPPCFLTMWFAASRVT